MVPANESDVTPPEPLPVVVEREEVLAPKAILRAVLIIVAVVIALYLIIQLRTPLTWLIIAAFIAVPLATLAGRLEQFMPRWLAIVLVYVGLILTPVGLGAILVPPLVTEGNNFVNDVPGYAQDITEFVENNERLRELEAEYDITTKLEEEAAKLPGEIGDAATILQDVGFGIVSSLFAILTILVLSVFMVSGGPMWARRIIELQPPARAEQLDRVLRRIAAAVGGYFAGALAVAFVAGIANYIAMVILGVPFAGPLAVMAGLASLIPMVGATIAAVLIGLVTLFTDFPTTTIIWAIWAVLYQQFENHLIQPQIQKRTVNVSPFVTIVAVLMGGTLLGILGALLAIPIAASIQILLNEWWTSRQQSKLPPRGEDGPVLPVAGTAQSPQDDDGGPEPPGEPAPA
ncbi:MAG: AI-2E family transporter [Solirubrobacteraceae bacterium]|nr:AI-2E family transporter [Solirubrobacteraceae bacterium]